jgi:hypothetical protein
MKNHLFFGNVRIRRPEKSRGGGSDGFYLWDSFSNDDIGGSSFRFILMGEPFPVGVARIVYGNGNSMSSPFCYA